MAQLINIKDAKKEIKGLSRNTKLYLQDVLKNDLYAIQLAIQLENKQKNIRGIEETFDTLINNLCKTGIFTID